MNNEYAAKVIDEILEAHGHELLFSRRYALGLAKTALLAAQSEPATRAVPVAPYVDIVFDGPPCHESGRFVEVESPVGRSINFGEWIHRDDGYWALRFTAPTPDTERHVANHAEGTENRLVLRQILYALTERQKGNVIRSEDVYVDEARAYLTAPAQPTADTPPVEVDGVTYIGRWHENKSSYVVNTQKTLGETELAQLTASIDHIDAQGYVHWKKS